MTSSSRRANNFGACCGTARFTNEADATLTKQGAGEATFTGLHFENQGAVLVQQGIFGIDGGTLANLNGSTLAGGTWGVGFDATLRLLDADIITNRAELLLDGQDAALQSRNTTSALAHLAVNDGGLALAEGADLTVPGDFTNNGRLALSSDSVLTVNGNFTQRAAGNNAGTPDLGGELQVDVGDLANALIQTTGDATLAGRLAIRDDDGVQPTAGQFTIVDAGSSSGRFTTVDGTDIGNGSHYAVDYDDPLGIVRLVVGLAPIVSVHDTTVTEGAVAHFTLTLDQPATQPTQVLVRTSDGSATSPDDYETTIGSVTFATGEDTKTFDVATVDDTVHESDESFTLDVTGGDAIAVGSGTATIVDNDAAPTVTAFDAVASEGGTVSFTLQLSGASDTATAVEVTTSDGTATAGTDYIAVDQIVGFGPGVTEATIDVPTTPDTLVEANETFTLTLSNPAGLTIATPTATATIFDDDFPAIVPGAPISASEGGGGVTIPVRLQQPSPRDITAVAVTTLGQGLGSADNSDFLLAPTTLFFPAGSVEQDLTLIPIDDNVDEPDETFSLTLLFTEDNPLDTRTITITDNDPPPMLSIEDASVTEGDNGTTERIVCADARSAFGVPRASPCPNCG